jgi:membrane protease YdiL (CAAX protease family)
VKREATLAPAEAGLSRRRRVLLATEFVLLFFGAVGAYALAGSPGSPIPVLLLGGLAAVLYLRRRPDFDRGSLLRAEAVRPALPRILALWLLAALVAVVAIAIFDPERLFNLPRHQPLLWILIAVFYPLLSVYPQELLFRAFLLHRYRPVFGSGRAAAGASAAAFGFAHIIFGSLASVILTLVGGWLFARRYQRTGSLLTASVEHALYGVLAFTVGLGDLFYHGAALGS